jgi:hypothetical protein
VLFRWLEWTTEEEVRTAVSAHVADDANLVIFIGRFVSESHSHTMGDKVSRVHRKIGKKGLAHLLDLEAATARLKEVQSGSTDQATVAGELVAMLEAKAEDPWDE